MKPKTTAISPSQIRNILKHCEVPACWNRAFVLLAIHGVINDRRFGRYVLFDAEFKAALGMMLDILSAPGRFLGTRPAAVRRTRKAFAIASGK